MRPNNAERSIPTMCGLKEWDASTSKAFDRGNCGEVKMNPMRVDVVTCRIKTSSLTFVLNCVESVNARQRLSTALPDGCRHMDRIPTLMRRGPASDL